MSELYNHDHENEVTIFAETNFRSQRRRFGIKTDDRRRHMYIIGKTGMGKTQLQENMVMSDIMAGHGVCYVDPHGDTAERILDLIPSNRVNDVVYFNPADMEFPVGFNILETANDNQKHLIASGLMGVFKKIWPDVWSPRMEYILLNCVLALIDYPGATLLGINRLLVDKDYRERVIAKIRDPIVKTFWVAEFTSWEVKYQTEAIAPIQNKVGQFLSASIIRNIVSQVKSTIDVRSIMDDSKIFIVNLSKGRIGEENMKLLGGMLISRLQMAAMERVGIPEAQRKDFYMFVDEFQNFATESFASILSEARKYRLNLIVAHQYIEQLTDEVKAAVIGNVGTIIAFRIGATDAEFLENEFSPTFTAEDLVNLTKFTVYLKLMVDGVSTSPFSASTLPPLAQFTGNSDKIIAVSRERYAMPRAQIAEKVLRWSGMESASLRIADEAAADALAQSSELDKTENDLNINISDAIAEDRSSQTDEAKSPASENKYMSAGSRQGGDEQRKANSEDLDEFGNPENEEEYLKISPERLKALVKPTQGKKKDKPMFSHTCSRCGKVWEMPIQLDASRPMFCADCLPIIKEEQKNKGKIVRSAPAPESRAMPARESTSGGRGAVAGGHQSFSGKNERKSQGPNRPRIIGDLPSLSEEPSYSPLAIRHSQPEEAKSPAPENKYMSAVSRQGGDEKRKAISGGLLADLQRLKGKPIETRKSKVDKRTNEIRDPQLLSTPLRAGSARSLQLESESDSSPGSKVEDYFFKLDKDEDGGSAPKTLRPGQKATF